jgi:hypothetical protein
MKSGRCVSAAKQHRTGPASPRDPAYVLGVQLEPEVDLPEMIVAREDVHDPQVLHDDRTGEIDEGDIRLVVILLANLLGAAELLG